MLEITTTIGKTSTIEIKLVPKDIHPNERQEARLLQLFEVISNRHGPSQELRQNYEGPIESHLVDRF